MKNIWRLFIGDIKRITSNVITVIIVLGLVSIPSIFSGYNILACWDVFGNTGNLMVAVANTDEGYKSDLVPLRINIGEQLVSTLRANDQLSWTITSEEDAVDGTKSGKYYAAVIIPASFSEDMMTFYSDKVEHAQIVYYTNEKKSAVAPKITDQGADTISYQVNEVFTQTITEIALGISSSLYKYADDADASGLIGDLATHTQKMGSQMTQAASLMTMYAQIAAASQQLVESSADLLSLTRGNAQEIGEEVAAGNAEIATVASAMDEAADALTAALEDSSAGYVVVGEAIDAAFTSTGTLATDSVTQLRSSADALDTQITQYEAIVLQLEQFMNQVDDQSKPLVEAFITRLNLSIDLQKSLRDQLRSTADSIEQGNANAQAQHGQITQLVDETKQSIDELKTNYDEDIKPIMNELSAQMDVLVDSLKYTAGQIDAATESLIAATGPVASQLDAATSKLENASRDLMALSASLTSFGDDMAKALSTKDITTLRSLLQSDPATLAAAFAAPIALDKHAVFPADNFGSQMAPLYSTLALWIGALLLVVALQVSVSKKTRDELDNPKSYQLFLGRFGVFSVLSFMQTTCMVLSSLYFLQVQANNPFLYLLCFWIAGQVFTFFIYSLVVSFANLGKAIGVLFLILQVTAAGGSFPLQVLPSFFQQLSPYMPATHVINAMRAAMMGVFQNDFWVSIGLLLLFLIPAALLGLVLSRPLAKFLAWYTNKVEDSKIVS